MYKMHQYINLCAKRISTYVQNTLVHKFMYKMFSQPVQCSAIYNLTESTELGQTYMLEPIYDWGFSIFPKNERKIYAPVG